MALSKKRGTFTPTDPHREPSGKAGGGSSVCVKLLDGTVLTYGLVDVSPATEYSSRCQQLIRSVQVQVVNTLSLACILHCGYHGRSRNTGYCFLLWQELHVNICMLLQCKVQ